MGQFADLTDDGFSPQSSTAPLAVRFGAETSPDKAAEALSLARRYNLPPAVAQQFQEDYKARALTEDAAAIFKQSPRLRSWIDQKPERAAVAQDDLKNLSEIERNIARFGELRAPDQIKPSFSTIASGLFENFKQGFEMMREGGRMQVGDALGLPIEDSQRRFEQAKARTQAADPMFETETARGLYGGGASTLRMIPGTLAAIATRNPSLGLLSAGLQTETEAYGKYRTRGATAGEAFAGAAGEGIVEVATEKIPMGFLVDRFGKAGTAEFLKGMLLREMPTEQVATFLQDAIDTAVANPDKTWGEFFAERPSAAYQTALGVLVQSSVFGAANTVAGRMSGERRASKDAELAAEQAGALAKLADASALRGRDAESFRDYVQQVADEQGDTPTEFYIDGATLARTLDQSGISMQELEAIAPVVASQLDAALTGGDVRIPVSEFLAAGEAVTAPLLDHLKTDPGAMTRAEAQEFIKTEGERAQQDLEREAQRQQDQNAFRDQVKAVRAEFQAELDQTKRFRPEVNKAYADLLANFYATTAGRLGMTPQELVQRYRLRVQSSIGAGDKVLNQGDILDLGDLESLMQQPGQALGAQDNASGESSASLEAQSRVADEKARGRDRVILDVATGQVAPLVGVDAVDTQAGPGKLVLQRGVGANEWTVLSAGQGVTRNAALAAIGRGKSAGTLNQGETPRAQIALPENFDVGQAIISLLQGADLTSFIHESGHLFLEIQADLAIKIQQQIAAGASVSEGERGIVADFNRLLDWFGIKGNESISPIEEWAGMTLEEKRAHHEQFARGFEAFAMEGKAPSLELQSVFQRFRSWLMQVYKTLRNLNVELTDDVRAVMGRMLASDFAIEEAEAARSMGPLFKTAEEAGMTLEEFNAYQDLAGKATQNAIDELQVRTMKDMKWLSRARDKALKARQQEVEELRREVRQEVRAEVMAEPVYRAWQFLTAKGDQGDTAQGEKASKGGAQIDLTRDNLFTVIAKHGGLNRDEVTKLWGIDSKDKLESGVFGKPVVRKTGGLSIDSMLERLVEDGYILPDENGKGDPADFEAKFDAQLRGSDQFSTWHDYAGDAPVEPLSPEKIAGKLNTEALREQYGSGEKAIWRKLSALRMTSDTGIAPEVVAETFGFDSGDALVKGLAEATPPREVIEARTDQRMLERFGDITSAEALQRAADEAVHNEARARFIASELAAVQKASTVREKAGPRSSINVLARAAKDYAEQIVARLKVRDIRPAQYAAAEARSARLAEKALGAGKTEEVAMHKRNQLVNNYATGAAYDAQAEVKRIADYFRRLEKRPGSVDPGYLDQIEKMLERFDFKPASLKEVDRRKSLAAWYEEQVAVGNVPTISDDLLDEANRKSYKDMTVEELRGLRDAVKNIEHLGRVKNRLLLARDQRTFDAAAEQIESTIRDNGGKPRDVQLEGEKGFRYWLEGVAAMHRKLSSLFRQMDGGKDNGPLYELIGRAMNERGAWEDTQMERATVALSKLYKPLTKMSGGITGVRSKVFIPEIKASLTRGGRLAVALNWGNADNRQRIMDGDKWSEGQVRAILSTLTKQELQFVNGVWEFIDSYWPEIAAKEKRLSGVEPEKVKAEPFTVKSADGETVEMRGGYYPLKYDADRSDRAEQQEAAQVAKDMMRGAMTRATTRRGHTKERLQEVKRAVRKDLNVITQHVTQVVHDLAWHEWLIDTNRLMRDDRIVDAIREHYGPKVLKTVRDDIAGIATADVVPMTDIDRGLLTLRSNVSRATMGASLTTAFLQPFGLTQSMARIGTGPVLRGAARWAGDAVRLENSLASIQEKSEFMRLRSKTFNRELREISSIVRDKSAAMRAVDGGLFWLMQKMQLVADVPTWIGQYEKSKAEGLDEDAAIAQADRAVIEAQGAGSTKDLAEVQRKYPMLTQFYSYFNTTLNLVAEKTATTDFKSPRAVAGWLGDMALLLAIPSILPAMLMHLLRGGGDDPEELAKHVIKWQAGYLMGLFVGIREGSGAIEGYDYAGPPVGRIVTDIKRSGESIGRIYEDGDIEDKRILPIISLLGTAFGIPTVQAIRSYKGWKAWDDGEAGPQAILFGPPPKN